MPSRLADARCLLDFNLESCADFRRVDGFMAAREFGEERSGFVTAPKSGHRRKIGGRDFRTRSTPYQRPSKGRRRAVIVAGRRQRKAENCEVRRAAPGALEE